jgi:hypothetical protein
MPYPSGATSVVFNTISITTRQPRNADSTPTLACYKNGTVDGTVTFTVSNPSTGVYIATYTVPAGYSAGDRVQILATATVGGYAGNKWVDSYDVAYPPADVWGYVMEDGLTAAELFRVMLSAHAGERTEDLATYPGYNLIKYRDLQDTLDRIVAKINISTGDREILSIDGT